MKTISLALILMFSFSLYSQKKDTTFYLTLENVIQLAADSSLDIFIAQNNYLAEYWIYKKYKAGKLPYIDLNSTVVDFDRSLEQEYSYNDSAYHYVDQQTISSYVNLSLNQNISKIGGRIYIDSDLGRLQNLNQNASVQFSSTIIRVGFKQELIGYNSYKWDDKISPLRYEKSKREYLRSVEEISVAAIGHFFNLALCQAYYEIAKTNYANADTLYTIGKERYKIASISQEDLFTLQLGLINGQNDLKTARKELRRAKSQIHSFLRLDEDINIDLILPDTISDIQIDELKALALARDNNPEYLDYKQQLLEAEQEVDQTRKESKLSSTLSASFGLYQSANDISRAYISPKDQEMVNLTLNIPIVDWGAGKGNYKMALRQQEATRLQIEQDRIDFEQNLINSVEEFIIQKGVVIGAARADTIAQKVYKITKEQFLIGNSDLTKLGIAQQSKTDAKIEYINALENYWNYYYTLRKLTLYDFIDQKSLSDNFDMEFEAFD